VFPSICFAPWVSSLSATGRRSAVGCFLGFAPGLSEEGGSAASGGRAEPPFVLFICQDDAQRDDFLACADGELTAHLWHPSSTVDQHEYVGRRRILFCDEHDVHLAQCHAHRLPPYPPGHPARRGHDADVRGVRLPGSATSGDIGPMPRREGDLVAAVDAGDLNGSAAA
jgi:hypothetical protein